MSIDQSAINDPYLPAGDLLTLLRIEDEKLLRIVHGLSPLEWAQATNCPGWDVHQMVAHLAWGADLFISTVEKGLQGDYSTLTPEDRQARFESYISHSNGRLLDAVERQMDRFQLFFGGLTPAELRTESAYAGGRRIAHLFINQRLAEVSLHSWDIRTSLGREQDFDPGVAAALLPLIVLDNLRILVHSKEPFVAQIDRWRVALPGGGVTSAPAEITLNGSPTKLSLFLYGRDRTLSGLEVTGNTELASALSGQ